MVRTFRDVREMRDVGALGSDIFTLTQIEAHLAALEKGLLVYQDDALITSYPRSGGRRAVPNGDTSIDLITGVVKRPDASEQMSAGLRSFNLPYVRSGLIWVDTDVDAEALMNDKSMGKFSVDQCSFFPLQGFPFTSLKLTSDYSFNFKARFSSLPVPQPPPQVSTGFQERYGTVTTTNSFTAVPIGPIQGGALAAAYSQDSIYCPFMGAKVVSVYNSGAQSADLNLQILIAASGTWADDPSTGASTTLASGNTALIESGLAARLVRLRVKSTNTGSPTTLAVSYMAFTATR